VSRPTPPPAAKPVRDLRLDFFRGLSLWFIFVDHIPFNSVRWVTVGTYGFSDAAEIFVFISGYTAAFVYGRVMEERGFVVGAARVLKRVWQLYVAYVFLSVLFIVQIAYVSTRFDNPLYAEELHVLHFLEQPGVVLLEALRLRFLLPYVDVLPLYVVLMLFFPLMLWLLLKSPYLALAISVGIYLVTKVTDLNLHLYPVDRPWFFNPFAWQLLFMIGAWCAVGRASWLAAFYRSNVVLAICTAYVVVALALTMTTYVPVHRLPQWLIIFPLDKTGLSPVRLAHFLALAILVARFVRPEAAFLRSAWAAPVILCGQHSLEVFCLGVFLSFSAYFVLVEVSARVFMQVAVSVAGVLLMVALAGLMTWYKDLDRRARQPAT
jgi:hypothetical protein